MWWNKKRRVYLDYASFAPRDEHFFSLLTAPRIQGNPSSLHKEGVEAKTILEDARKEVADALHALPREIFFTSGGTEGDTTAISGVISGYKGKTTPHVIVSSVEHSAVLETVRYFEAQQRITLSYIPVDAKGVIDIKELKNLIRPDTILVSVMLVNNEVGTIEPVTEVAKTIRHFKKNNTPADDSVYPLFHIDACQAPNYLPIDVRALHPDLLTINGSKLYAGAGVGALYIRHSVQIPPLLHGGDQERGVRPGTENVKGIFEFSKALTESMRVREKEMQKYDRLRKIFVEGIDRLSQKYGVSSTVLSDPFVCVPAIVNISFAQFESELLVIELDAKGIAVSSKSACKSESTELSHVLSAMGTSIPPEIGSIRFSFGRWTTHKDIVYTLSCLEKIFLKYKK